MNFNLQLEHWANGETAQGKIMIGASILLALISIALLKNDNGLLKGMLIPLCLLMAVNIGYGSYLVATRQKEVQRTQAQFARDAQQTLNAQLDKAKADNKTYGILRAVWAMLIVLCVVLHFVFARDYFRGMSLGFATLFLGTLIIDTFLHARLHAYLTALQQSVYFSP